MDHPGDHAADDRTEQGPGPEPGSPAPGGPDPGSPDPGGADPGDPDPGGPDPGDPDPGGPDPGDPDPAGPEAGGADGQHSGSTSRGDAGSAGPRERSGQDRGHALAELARAASPPPPPRRTGVFLDPVDLREHVGELLRAILGGYEVDAFGNFTFAHEGARVVVTIGRSPIGPQVGVFSVTNLDVDLTPELGQYLLTANHTLAFGAFSYDVANRAVWLRHSLHGSTLDLPELQSAVAAVATTASQVDDTIRERFGGRLFEDAPDDVQRRVEPPDTSQDGPPNATGYL